jgi:hypothetical protein
VQSPPSVRASSIATGPAPRCGGVGDTGTCGHPVQDRGATIRPPPEIRKALPERQVTIQDRFRGPHRVRGTVAGRSLPPGRAMPAGSLREPATRAGRRSGTTPRQEEAWPRPRTMATTGPDAQRRRRRLGLPSRQRSRPRRHRQLGPERPLKQPAYRHTREQTVGSDPTPPQMRPKQDQWLTEALAPRDLDRVQRHGRRRRPHQRGQANLSLPASPSAAFDAGAHPGSAAVVVARTARIPAVRPASWKPPSSSMAQGIAPKERPDAVSGSTTRKATSLS